MALLRVPLIVLALLAALLACAPADPPVLPDGGAGTGGGTGGVGGFPADPPLLSPVALTIQPGAGRSFLLDGIEGAIRSVRVMSYLVTDGTFRNALNAARARGVDVRVIVERTRPENDDARRDLIAAGVAVREGSPDFALTHAKVVVVDEQLAFVLNQNLTRAGFEGNREYNVAFTGVHAAQLAAIFDADWERTPFTQESALVLSPTNSRARLRALVKGAREELTIAMEVLNDDQFKELLAARARSGLKIELLLEDPADVADHRATATLLKNAGVDVRWLESPELHAKAIVADRRLAYTGSVNLTFSSLDKNREVGVITDHPSTVSQLLVRMDADFAAGRTDF